jgi:hypothetical protein
MSIKYSYSMHFLIAQYANPFLVPYIVQWCTASIFRNHLVNGTIFQEKNTVDMKFHNVFSETYFILGRI